MANKHHICILGGSGFVGRHLVARLAKDGHYVKVLTRHRERHRELLVYPNISVVETDIHQESSLNTQFADADVVIDLVGIINEQGKNNNFRTLHVTLPRKIVAACRSNNISRLLHMSALNAGLHFGSSQYLQTKGEGEQLVHVAIGIHVTSFRPAVIFGPDDNFFNRFAQLLKLVPYFFPLACPNTKFAPVYVGDVIASFVRAMDDKNTFGQRYDLCGPGIYTLRELVQYTADQLGIKRNIIALGSGLSRLQARIMEFVPGKPFSLDNYKSLQKDSICRNEFPALFDLAPTAIEAVVPHYLGRQGARTRYFAYRRQARREV